MKTKISIIIAICSLCLFNASNQRAFAGSNLNPDDSIKVISSPDLNELATSWISEYCKVNPGTKIKLVNFTEDQLSANFKSEGNLYFLSNDYISDVNSETVLKMVIGVEAIVPIISSKNPLLNEINLKGISPETLSQLISNPEKQNWATFGANENRIPLKLYIVNNESIKMDLANFMKIDPAKINGINVISEEELVSKIQRDPYAIGLCMVSTIIYSKNQSLAEGVQLLPIDKNSNGKIDYNEKIYDDMNSFLRGVWIGKYPRELCRNIYSISSMQSANKSEVAFLTWVITSGQQFLNPNGYSDIAYNQRQANFDKLNSKEVVVESSKSRSALLIAIVGLALIIALTFFGDYAIQRLRRKMSANTLSVAQSSPFFDEKSVVVPDGLFFDKSHTWAFMDKNGTVEIGIDDFLQHVTGPITGIKMKNPGEQIKKGDPFFTIIQDGKQLNIKAPLSGTIKEQNKKLLTNSSTLNSSPYGEGWIYTIEPTNWLRDIQFLIIAQGYKEWIRMEFLHLKDFLALTLRANYTENTQVVLQDGGEIKNGILKDLKPEVWEDFQTHFLDSSK